MMNDIMVRPLAPGSRLTAIFDSCHSGTALDLPYVSTYIYLSVALFTSAANRFGSHYRSTLLKVPSKNLVFSKRQVAI